MSTVQEESRIDRLFEDCARRSPDSIAARCGIQLTYGELDRCANRLARHLRTLGVGRGSRVGLCANRSLEALAGMLAVLKAGGAYVPLDPSFPTPRLLQMLDDAGCLVAIGQRDALGALRGFKGRCVALDGIEILFAQFAAARESLETAPESLDASAGDLAYVLYTSGSTGAPKGVAVPHRAVARLVRGQSFARMDAQEVWLHAAPLGFDASTLEVWAALLNGGTVAVLATPQPSLDAIAQAITSMKVTSAWLTAGLFHLMVDRRLDALRPLRQLLAGGDVLNPAQVRKVRRELPSLRLVNGYGPTENTTFSCCHVIEALEDGRPVPIGRPIAGSTAVVLDEQRRLVPQGTAGELYVGGEGLAQGYLGQPALTAERFVANPFGPGRLYRTGDRARLLPSGDFEFLGRLDEQVKLRGFRVEPGEIECALAAHPSVRAVAVAARAAAGHLVLIAWVVPRDPAAFDASALREFLAQRLPAHLVPAGFVALPELPLTANGKLDRTALPDWRPPTSDSEQDPAAIEMPRTQLEALIAKVWREVLRLEQVPLRSNFFDLGGDSLLLLEAHGQLQALLGRELPVTQLFAHPTIASLAAALEPAGPTADLATAAQGRAARQREALLRRKRPIEEC